MLHSCGNSSRLLLRKKPPIGVRCALGSASKCVPTAGVSTHMLRNFGILNSLLYRPTRSDQYRVGPGEVSRTATATSITGIAKTTAANTTNKRSNIRFKLLVLLPLSSSLDPESAATSSPVNAGFFQYPFAKSHTSAGTHPADLPGPPPVSANSPAPNAPGGLGPRPCAAIAWWWKHLRRRRPEMSDWLP